MPSARPYSGMSWDDLEKRIDRIMAEFAHEVFLIDEELSYRTVPSAKQLQQRVKRIKDFFVRGSYNH